MILVFQVLVTETKYLKSIKITSNTLHMYIVIHNSKLWLQCVQEYWLYMYKQVWGFAFIEYQKPMCEKSVVNMFVCFWNLEKCLIKIYCSLDMYIYTFLS